MPGQPRHPDAGRKVGTPNKIPALASILKEHNFDPILKLIAIFPSLKEEKQADILVKLIEILYVKTRESSLVVSPEQLAVMVRQYLESLDDRSPKSGSV